MRDRGRQIGQFRPERGLRRGFFAAAATHAQERRLEAPFTLLSVRSTGETPPNGGFGRDNTDPSAGAA